MCTSFAQSRDSRAVSRDKCAFTGGDVRQCAVKCAHFSREAFSFKNSSCHQKSLWTHFLATILRGLSRVILRHLDQSRVISTDFIYTRARISGGVDEDVTLSDQARSLGIVSALKKKYTRLMIKRLFILLCGGVLAFASPLAATTSADDHLQIRSVIVDNKPLSWKPGEALNLGAFPRNILFNSGLTGGPSHGRMERLRTKLEGLDREWREGGGEMFVTIRFYNAAGDLVAQKTFSARGDSSGWNGSVEGSPFTHRRETFSAPPGASRLWVIISSAGGPTTVGTYVVDNLIVSRLSPSNSQAEVLLRSPSPQAFARLSALNQAPEGWIRDGTRPSMAKVLPIGPRGVRALAVVDDDPMSHAEWHNSGELAPRVAPNDNLLVEWNEMHSIGNSGYRSDYYESLPPGAYTFRVAEYSVSGTPTGVEASLSLRVPLPYWQSAWFWAALALLTVASSALSVRYLAAHKMRRAMARLEQQRALERERLRIARDIHDDLGARVTEISLMSAMARNNQSFSEQARDEFHRITLQSRELVSALYETVWAVNPENDNLEAVGNYLRQRINSQCTQGKLRCRLHISPLPSNVEISSRVRHNISMAAREAMHNVIKHAEASQVTVRISFVDMVLVISLQDDGCGFDPVNGHLGNGLVNMKQRLEDIGGLCSIESSRGSGATITFRLNLSGSPEPLLRAQAAKPAAETVNA